MQGGGGDRGEKWDNCNSVINKIYLNKEIKFDFEANTNPSGKWPGTLLGHMVHDSLPS